MSSLRAAGVALSVLAAGCSLVVGGSLEPYDGAPADFAGAYGLQVTYGPNGCELPNWDVGRTVANVPLTITQDGADLTGELDGLWGGLADLWLGNRRATGTASGEHMSMRLVGTRRQSVEGGCTNYNLDAIFEGDLDGDFLTGTTTYTAVTSEGSAPCVALQGCESVQNFTGARPPR